ncbi:myelin-oligodendrocyte glycoprotein-like [Acanthopagrus schlegelii]
MIATLLTLLMISALAAGELRVSCQNRILIDSLVLQCQVDPRVDLSALTMDVKRPDLQHEGRPRVKDVVHAYRHQHDFLTDQMDQYKGRTTLNREDLKNGTITLQISSVGPSDSGRYKIFVPQLNASRLVDVTVCENRTNTSTSGPPVEDVTEPDSPDAAETEAVRTRRSHIPSVCAAAVVLVLVLVLVKCLKT